LIGENIWNNVREWFSDKNERTALIRSFNKSAKDAFIVGLAPTLLKASVSRGNSDFKHNYSKWMSSGFRIVVFSGRQLTKDEMKMIGSVILSDPQLVRKLVVLGWDTVELHGDQGSYGIQWRLKGIMAIG
jgi:hypothetical protein